jgi:acyl carrier protein
MRQPDRETVLAAIAEFVTEHFPEVLTGEIERLTASQLIHQSLELVEFVLHLEDRLGIEININNLGEALITSTFGQLADRIVMLEKPVTGNW